MPESLDVAQLKQWVGKTESDTDTVTPFPVEALAATLDHKESPVKSKATLPELWHWLYFLPTARRSALGQDGHPERGGFLPPVPLPRRMWAGSQFEFHLPLAIGDIVLKRSTIDDVSHKTGKSGELVFVKVRHELHQLSHTHELPSSSNKAITEYHDIVYRSAPNPSSAVDNLARQAPQGALWKRKYIADDITLFRYSALTFNGHRIHYDRQYVTTEEGYPGLVVHGPLIATLLLDTMRQELQLGPIKKFTFKAVAPIFDTDAFYLCGQPNEEQNEVRLWAENSNGELAMEAVAHLC